MARSLKLKLAAGMPINASLKAVGERGAGRRRGSCQALLSAICGWLPLRYLGKALPIARPRGTTEGDTTVNMLLGYMFVGRFWLRL